MDILSPQSWRLPNVLRIFQLEGDWNSTKAASQHKLQAHGISNTPAVRASMFDLGSVVRAFAQRKLVLAP
jgi:hypothetical protein